MCGKQKNAVESIDKTVGKHVEKQKMLWKKIGVKSSSGKGVG
jgi:hypothetical protein